MLARFRPTRQTRSIDIFLQRFWAKVDRDGPILPGWTAPPGVDPKCWEWTGARDSNGYGHFRLPGSPRGVGVVSAHCFAWELAHGPMPGDSEPDHLCKNRGCVNPAHLELVPHRENALRGSGPTARNARKTHCKRGHEFTPENTYVDSEGRRRLADGS